ELPVADRRLVGALLLERVLDLEQVGEVGAGLDADRHVDRVVLVVQDGQLFGEAFADRPLADLGYLRVHIDGSRSGNEEEPRLEVLQVVRRERVQALAVDGQHPLREEACVVGEQSRRVGERGFDVASVVADDEGVAVEDLDETVAHRRFFLGGLGNRRCSLTRSLESPAMTLSPRTAAANAFASPVAIRSKRSAGALTVQSPALRRCETSTSPLSIATSHRSTLPFFTRSNRTVPVVVSSIGSCPRLPRASKNSVVAAPIFHASSLGDRPPSRASRIRR